MPIPWDIRGPAHSGTTGHAECGNLLVLLEAVSKHVACAGEMVLGFRISCCIKKSFEVVLGLKNGKLYIYLGIFNRIPGS